MTTLISNELQKLLQDDKAIEDLYSKLIAKKHSEFEVVSSKTSHFNVILGVVA